MTICKSIKEDDWAGHFCDIRIVASHLTNGFQSWKSVKVFIKRNHAVKIGNVSQARYLHQAAFLMPNQTLHIAGNLRVFINPSLELSSGC